MHAEHHITLNKESRSLLMERRSHTELKVPREMNVSAKDSAIELFIPIQGELKNQEYKSIWEIVRSK